MAQLFYANLGAAGLDGAFRQVFGALGDAAKYLERSRQHRERTALSLVWRGLESAVAGEDDPIWVEVDSPDDGSQAARALREVMRDETREVYETPDELERPAKYLFPRELAIQVLDRDPDRLALQLERRPATERLRLRPNTYTLVSQRNALRALENAAHAAHRPLVSLCRPVDQVEWPTLTTAPLDEEDWVFLRADKRGHVRPGTDEQRRFVEVALATPDFAVLEGPPGSGKTTAICELIAQTVSRDPEPGARPRVLLCASTHVAVDNVLERLMRPGQDRVLPVRIGDPRNVSEAARQWQLDELCRTKRSEITGALRKVKPRLRSQDMFLQVLEGGGSETFERILLDSANLVCGTTIGILQHPDLRGTSFVAPEPPFDLLIIDEASKTTFVEMLVPALWARRWVIVGDLRQLSPYVEEEELAASIDEIAGTTEQRRAALSAYLASGGADEGAVVVATTSLADRKAHEVAASRRATPFADLDDSDASADPWRVPLARLVIGSPARLAARLGELPLDARVLREFGPSAPALETLRRRVAAAARGARGRRRTPDQDATWGSEIAWRLARSFERRLLRVEGEGLEGEGEDRELDEARRLASESWDDVDRIRRVALPSVLESLQRGFPADGVDAADESRRQTALSKGLPEDALRDRLVRLTYQHRMHPQLSRIPRDHVYEGGALKDPRGQAKRREWPDGSGPWPRRLLWHAVRAERGQDSERNVAEARAVVEELRRFAQWADGRPRPEPGVWEVAVLTFYQAQWRLLRDELRRLTRSHGSRRFPFGGLEVVLGTVDRFQGHEADVVLLSFGRSHGVGFLDSPNRLNVALTRARYQLVLIGNRENFRRQNRSALLRVVAEEPASYDLASEDAAS